MEEEIRDRINMFIHEEVEKRCHEIEEENARLIKSEWIMKKFINFMWYWILWAIVNIVMWWLFIAVAYWIYLLMINYKLWIVWTLLLFFWILWFIIWIITYLDDNDEEQWKSF